MTRSSDSWVAVILAAGQGKRMRSALPKVLHPLAGRSMLGHVREAVAGAGIRRCIVVVSPQADGVRRAAGGNVEFAEQALPLGTGHALLAAREVAAEAENVLVLNGDVPLITPKTLKQLMKQHQQHEADLTFLTALVEDAADYGRVHRDERNAVVEVVEAAELEGPRNGAAEINTGQYCFRSSWLWAHLDSLAPAPNGELYLTSLVEMAAREGAAVATYVANDASEVRGINDRWELAVAERVLRQRINHDHMLSGVTFLDPETAYVDAGVTIGRDTIIESNTRLRGATVVGERCVIGADSDLRDSTLGEACRIAASTIEESTLEGNVEVGPYSHLRPGSHLSSGVHIGNFAEVKNSRLERDVKMGHHSYMGDADVGEGTNVGAGTITCNFDGEAKHRTRIGKHVFLGSDTMLVAPLTIGDDARTAAGSVVTKDVPSGALAVGAPARIMRGGGARRDA